MNYLKILNVCGIDSDKKSLKENKIIKNKQVGFAEKLPYKNNSFDILIFLWVFEHLKNPEKAIQETERVLKKNGKLVFLTPNKYSFWIICSKVIPQKLKIKLLKKFFERTKDDVYHANYKLNSTKKIEKLMQKNGFKKEELFLNNDPSFLSFNEFFFKISCFLSKFAKVFPFKHFQVHIIGKFRKISD